jgi:hypothetical protein
VIVAKGSTIDLLIFGKPILLPTKACLIDNGLLPARGVGERKADPNILHDMITVIDARQ